MGTASSKDSMGGKHRGALLATRREDGRYGSTTSTFPANSEVYATWYGVQTDGPYSNGVVTIDMWETNAKLILAYIMASSIPYTGWFVHIDPPTGSSLGQGKPNNAYAYVYRIAKFISQIPTQYRVGIQGTVEQDATWDLHPGDQGEILTAEWIAYFSNDAYWGKYGAGASQSAPCTTKPDGTWGCEDGSHYTCVGDGTRCVPNRIASTLGSDKPTPPQHVPVGQGPYCSPDVRASAYKMAGQAGSSAPITGSEDYWCVDATYRNSGALLGTGASGSSHELWGSGPTGSYAFPAPEKVQWYGGSGSVATAGTVGRTGAPYMQPTDSSYGFENPCPSAPLGTVTGAAYPEGCPNNAYHMGWYAALLNNLLFRMGSKQRVSMMNWDAEYNGPVGSSCSIFQFLSAVRAFSNPHDPLTPGTGTDPTAEKKWLMFQNGGPGISKPDPTEACGDWANVKINALSNWHPVSRSGAPTTLGDIAEYVPAPEFYWFNGEDMGSTGPQTPNSTPGECPVTGRNGMLQSLVERGFVGCPQSSSQKLGFDGNCGCRETVYDAYKGNVSDLLKLLQPLYTKYLGNGRAVGSAPTFSIEHLGNADNMVNFGLCINSINFAAPYADAGADLGCAINSKCAIRCGVANFFGNWGEKDFANYLATFLTNNGKYLADTKAGIPARISVYDVGFVPSDWMPTSQTLETTTYPFKTWYKDFMSTPAGPTFQPALLPPPSMSAVTVQIPPSVDYLNYKSSQAGTVYYMDPCPTRYDSTARATDGIKLSIPLTTYKCGSTETTFAYGPGDIGTYDAVGQKTPAGKITSAQVVPASLQCYDKSSGCSWTAGITGGIAADTRYFPSPAFCADAPTLTSYDSIGPTQADPSGSTCGGGGGGSSSHPIPHGGSSSHPTPHGGSSSHVKFANCFQPQWQNPNNCNQPPPAASIRLEDRFKVNYCDITSYTNYFGTTDADQVKTDRKCWCVDYIRSESAGPCPAFDGSSIGVDDDGKTAGTVICTGEACAGGTSGDVSASSSDVQRHGSGGMSTHTRSLIIVVILVALIALGLGLGFGLRNRRLEKERLQLFSDQGRPVGTVSRSGPDSWATAQAKKLYGKGKEAFGKAKKAFVD